MFLDLSTGGVLTENDAAKPAAVGNTDVLGVDGTTGDSSPPPGGGVDIADSREQQHRGDSQCLLLPRRQQSVYIMNVENTLCS